MLPLSALLAVYLKDIVNWIKTLLGIQAPQNTASSSASLLQQPQHNNSSKSQPLTTHDHIATGTSKSNGVNGQNDLRQRTSTTTS